MSFPLEQWFDVSQRISKADVELAEAQMGLYAIKDGLDPDGPEAMAAYADLHAAVKRHNRNITRIEQHT